MINKQRRIRILAVTSALILWLVENLYYFWVKIGGGIFLLTGTIELVCILTMVIAALILIWKIIKYIEWKHSSNFVILALLILLNLPGLEFNENTFQSKVKLRACYEGTMNTSRLFFRENGTFEDFNIGWFAFVHYTSGTWQQSGDTLYLNFSGEKPNLLEEKILIKENNLYKIVNDSLAPTFYYLGYCKGLN
jgi:hypothetical protein